MKLGFKDSKEVGAMFLLEPNPNYLLLVESFKSEYLLKVQYEIQEITLKKYGRVFCEKQLEFLKQEKKLKRVFRFKAGGATYDLIGIRKSIKNKAKERS